jgi:succinyl-CoA synthetase alpha subunit
VTIRSIIKPNLYKDSVALMLIAETVQAREGVRRATLLMGTAANKDILAEAGLLDAGVAGAGPNDVMLLVEADDAVLADALAEIEHLLAGGAAKGGAADVAEMQPRSLAMAVGANSGGVKAGLAQISVPGPYAAAEALKALRLGMHVFMFSDNVPLEQEQAIKQVAARKGLLVMGPDCGTAIINGVPLGFANVVRAGPIGIVAASGTGLQEVTTQIHRLGSGVSQAIGTGGRDVYEAIGGTTMLQGIEVLAADAATKVIVIVSKPPAPSVTEKVMARLAAIGKPAVVLFLGSAAKSAAASVHTVATLFECAAKAVALATGKPAAAEQEAKVPATGFAKGQRWLRGLYSGGTFCTEAQLIWKQVGLRTYSNVPVDKADALPNPKQASREHSAIDLGDDEFTVGRPHPMIDQSSRIERLLKEAADPEVAVIVLDVVLGYGAHADPAGALAPAIREAKAIAAKAGRELAIVAFACGTDADPQPLTAQDKALVEAGALVAQSSVAAARLAAALVAGIRA